ncbi:MAG TPA: zinc ABC transporter substrate-binding protein [Fimbriimonadaceae bacterium]|nr:zinc ABC transporter substrate-binding protein [Fimbriimonadaceae bacterium]HRJ32627.1 zinc ABC transporter substrate-binding protein [Fimbriimonadaceae bacterium]
MKIRSASVWAWLTGLLLASGMMVGCPASSKSGSVAGPPPSEEKLRVVATTMMVADLAREVGGQRVEVIALMGPGVDPHLYKASPGDIQLLEDADLVLYHGLHLEGKLADVLEKLGNRKPAVAITAGLDPAKLLSEPSANSYPDPHIWFDVTLWSQCISAVEKALSSASPDDQAEFHAQSEQVRKSMAELDQWVRKELATLPADRRLLITAHDAFRYFGRAYGIEVMGVQGISTESEAGLQEVNRIVDVLVRRKIPAIFVETSVSQKNVRAIVEGAQARGARVTIGPALLSDSMGDKGTPEATYEGMIRYNVSSIIQALK